MHPALQISELVQMIVLPLDPLSRGPGGMVPLAALAQCKIFHEPALDALWRYQTTIRNLINCMPADIWEFKIARAVPTMRGFLRPVHGSDWGRVLHYSHHIKSLVVNMQGRVYLSTFEVLRLSFTGTYLLPNLQTLRWIATEASQLSDIDLFLGPRIRSISLGELRVENLSLLATLTHKFPALIQADISCTAPDTAQSQCETAFSSFARGLQNVRSLHLDIGIDIEAITHIGRLPTLETLTLDPVLWASPLADLPQRSLFQRLRSADLFCPPSMGFQFAISLIQSWATPRLRSVQIGTTDFPTPDVAENLYRALSEHCVHDALEMLQISVGADATGYHILDGQALLLLSCFTNIVTVRITSPYGFLLTDENLANLAAAWPHIEQLHLRATENIRNCGTLLALRAFARHCPNLRRLELSFDARTVPPFEADSGHEHPPLHHALLHLNVGQSLISQASEVARFISATFINLDHLSTTFPVNENDIKDYDNLDEHEHVYYFDPMFAALVGKQKLWNKVREILCGLIREREGLRVSL
ncbi:hypothetical protein C8R45DRAFT_547701 [Mycena sanguinolenta]|nr:hypothetical protein C8R45DRAFT_547701 [Mycena sanguinolenta]